jgi:hypothetical protein
VDEEEALAAEQALRHAALHLHLVAHGRFDHDHAARIHDQPLPRCEVEVEEVPAAVEPDRPLTPQPLQEEPLATAVEAHAELLREGALDVDLAEMAEVRVLLADDLAVELVLADRAGERAREPDGSGCVRPVVRHEEALAREQLALQPAAEPAGHLHLHRDVARDERHRARLGRQLLARLERDDDGRRLSLPDLRFHR